MAVDDFASLIDPLAPEEFLASYYGRRWCFIPGARDKFEGLFDWNDVNHTLERHHLDWVHRDRDGAVDRPRLGMVQEGKNLRNDLLETRVMAPDRSSRRRVDPVAITHKVRGGATLYGGDLGDYHEGLGALAADVGQVLGERVKMGMHAVTRPVSGRKGHSDAFDIFVLQIDGRKRWTLRGRDPLRPIVGQAVAPNPDPGPVEFDEVLEPGDVLYLPVGWWHDPVAVDGPSLHMNVTILPRTGDHFLSWIRSRLQQLPSFQAAASTMWGADSPDRSGGRSWVDDGDREIVSALRADVASMIQPAELDRFLAEAAAEAATTDRLSFSFPDTGARTDDTER